MMLLNTPVAAGFPSPARDEGSRPLDLQALLVEHPESTFFWRVEGVSMEGMGIHHGDLLVVDRSLPPVSGSVVVAILDGGFVVKQFVRRPGEVILRSGHPDHAEIAIDAERELSIWGVVRWSLHRLNNPTSR
ncbi:MAG: translesion error-prone DNA polymerase V autoproteolytic subunit [Magnetococcales bacterium]|nr:translesion error-prone DNA polymerase V autoproteolytic subunit [Magnetococcales bacterium]